MIWGRDRARNLQAEGELAAFATRISSRVVDVSDEHQVVNAMVDTLSSIGRVDTVMANAGISPTPSEPWELPTEELHRVMRINFDGVFWTMREGGKAMMVGRL